MNAFSFKPVGLTVDAQPDSCCAFTASGRPELSWRIETDDPDFRQTACRIVAKNGSETVWDSGTVKSSMSQCMPWGGKPLGSEEKISVRVKVFNQNGTASDFSEPLVFETSLLHNSEWDHAKWIWFDRISCCTTPPSPCFRKEFNVGKGLLSARLYITARGVFEASLDGAKIGNDLLAPGWTDFKKQIPFMTYDLTRRLTSGKHALGAVTADGWCCGNLTILRLRNFYSPCQELLACLKLKYKDGSAETIVTDKSWKVSTGPILASDLYDGEKYDARLETPGWDSPGFDNSHWNHAKSAGPVRKTPELVQKTAPSVRYMAELKPVKILNPVKDTHIWDFGQNFTGTYRVRLRANRGRIITFRVAEMLDEKGELYTLNYRGALSTDSYISAGPPGKWCEYTPKFTFHGFRYLQIDGFQFDGVKAEELEVTGLVMHSAMDIKGGFTCGNRLVSRLWLNALWGQRGNFLEIPTDCPQRDERLGWTGDAQIFAPAAMLNMDCRAFYRKYLRDVRDAMAPDGAAPSIAPAILRIKDGAAGWGDAIILLPYAIYRHHGWKTILSENYQAMKSSVEWQKRHSENLVRPDDGFGDWLALENTPRQLVSTAYFARCAKCLAEIAGILGFAEDGRTYEKLFENIAAAFRKTFTDSSGIASPRTQTSLAMALSFGLLKPEDVDANAEELEHWVRENGCRISTGFLGTSLILHALEHSGHGKTARDMVLQEEYPSWLFPVRQGATTMWERWNSFTLEHGFGDVSMNSFNHYAYGSVSEFLISAIGGIHYTSGRVLFRIFPDIRFSPVKAFYDSPYGRISSEWSMKNGRIFWKTCVPPCVEASAVLPDGSEMKLRTGETQILQ